MATSSKGMCPLSGGGLNTDGGAYPVVSLSLCETMTCLMAESEPHVERETLVEEGESLFKL